LIPCPSPLISGFKSSHESFKGARVAVMLGKVSKRGIIGARPEVVRVCADAPGGLLSRVSLDALLLRLVRFAAAHVILLCLKVMRTGAAVESRARVSG
jgi:hypothetical protein